MTYARSRLWLGIFGVGSIVVSTQTLLFSGASYSIFSTTHEPSLTDITSLLIFETAFVALMFPLDLIGGLILPNFFVRQNLTARRFFFGWLSGIVLQMNLFLIVGLNTWNFARRGLDHSWVCNRLVPPWCWSHKHCRASNDLPRLYKLDVYRASRLANGQPSSFLRDRQQGYSSRCTARASYEHVENARSTSG